MTNQNPNNSPKIEENNSPKVEEKAVPLDRPIPVVDQPNAPGKAAPDAAQKPKV